MQGPEQASLSEYLESVGLRFHPFDQLEASADRRLNQHSIEHPVLFDAWARDVCFVVGEPGSGRTTVAEQVLYSCRTGEDTSRKFPIRLSGAELTSKKSIPDLAGHSAAVEALLQLAYRPWKFEELKPKDRSVLVVAIKSAAPGILAYFLPKIEKSGSLLPLAEFSDLPASALPGKADPKRVRNMAKQMRKLDKSENLAGGSSPSILEIVPGLLGFDEVKLVADFQAIPNPGRLDELDAVHNQLQRAGKKAALVTLVPPGSNSGGRRHVDGFTTWSEEQLVEVLRSRVKVASDRNFDDLSAISDPSMPREVEAEIVDEACKRGRRTPRDVLSLAKRVLEEGDREVAGEYPLISLKTFQTAVEKEFGEDS